MDTKNFLNIVCEQIKYKPVANGISEELEHHINDIKEEYIINGVDEKQAEERAVFQMGNAEEIGKKLNKIHKPKLDWKLILLISILTGFGIFATFVRTSPQEGVYVGNVGNVILYTIIGLILSFGIYFFDYKKIKKYSLLIYIISTILMGLPLFGIGGSINGYYYIRFLGFSFFSATITLPLYLISFIGFIIEYKKDNIRKLQLCGKEIKLNKDLSKIIILSSISLLLMMFMPSVANMVILGCAYLIVSTIKIIKDKEQHSVRNLAILYVITLAIIGSFVIIGILNSSFRIERIIYSFNPNDAPSGQGYIGMLQEEILQNAKVIGQAENIAFPIDESILRLESNYTFIYLIGKCGLLIAGLLVITIILTSIKLIFNARNIKEQYGKFLVIGLSSLFILQSFATVLMNINLGIQTNVSLPFVTYGGVHFVINMMSIAVILSAYRRKDINEFDKYSIEEIKNQMSK